MSSITLHFRCLPTAIGSLPNLEPKEACRLVLRYLPDIPAWPQLPRRSFKEGMIVQFSEGFPGLKLENDRIYIDTRDDLVPYLERLYSDNDYHSYAIGQEYASGLYEFMASGYRGMECMKGQMTGPVTWGLCTVNKDGLPVIYDDAVKDVVGRFLRFKAAWQENMLRQICKTTLIFLDEPSLASLGTAGTTLTAEQVLELLNEVLGGLSGLKGMHCCGNADWSLVLRTSIDVLNFDAYNYAESLSLYPKEVKTLLDKGGAVAWGIVPSDEEHLTKETVASLRDRLEEAMAPFTREGLRFSQLIDQSLLTPSCGMGYLSPEGAEHALKLLADLSATIRKRYS